MLMIFYQSKQVNYLQVNENKPEYEGNNTRLVSGITGIKSRFGIGL